MTKDAISFLEAAWVDSFNGMAKRAYDHAVESGFWQEPRNDGEAIALMHSELSECLESLRHGDPPDDKVPDFSGAETELADVIIRIMDMAQGRKWQVAEAVVAKMKYNLTRPPKHGKEF